MNKLVELWETPGEEEIYMIVGWRQWADAGAISSALPEYLIEHVGARKIGEFTSNDFYLFQFPGTHHLLRPEVKFEAGYKVDLRKQKNEFYYWSNEGKGLVIFIGDEPHMNVDLYAELFFDTIEALGVTRVALVAGVYGAMPYEKDRDISCVYSLPRMKKELEQYAVRFSDYEGGATIGSYLLDEAEQRGIELLVFYGFVPAYDLSQQSVQLQGLRIEHDYKAWYDLMLRLNYMFGLNIDLFDLHQQSNELISSMDDKIEALIRKMPQLNFQEYLDKVAEEFTERSFTPLSDVWQEGLEDLLGDLDD